MGFILRWAISERTRDRNSSAVREGGVGAWVFFFTTWISWVTGRDEVIAYFAGAGKVVAAWWIDISLRLRRGLLLTLADRGSKLLQVMATLTTSDERREELMQRPFLFIEEVAEVLMTSRSTIDRKIKRRVFPLRELPKIDRRARYAGSDVRRLLKEDR